MSWGRLGLAGLALLVSVSLGCSPEASRTQGGGPGADIGNHSQSVPLHGDGVMFYNTPREGQAITK
jgi:hypothetical protein